MTAFPVILKQHIGSPFTWLNLWWAEHEMPRGRYYLVPESAVLSRDCEECGGTGTYRVEVSTPPLEDSGDYPCEAAGCVGGRVRVGVCQIEPGEVRSLHACVYMEIAGLVTAEMSASVKASAISGAADRILALFSVKEQS